MRVIDLRREALQQGATKMATLAERIKTQNAVVKALIEVEAKASKAFDKASSAVDKALNKLDELNAKSE